METILIRRIKILITTMPWEPILIPVLTTVIEIVTLLIPYIDSHIVSYCNYANSDCNPVDFISKFDTCT